MTTTQTISTSVTSDRVGPVRRVLRTDAALCAAMGAAFFAGAGPLAETACIDPSWPVAATGAFLVGLAGLLLLLSRGASRLVLALTPWSAESDFLWVAASIAVALGVALTGPGRAFILAQAAIVACVGVAKLRTIRAAR
jgi:hypothetical protein